MTFALRSPGPGHLIVRFAYREFHLLLSTNYYVQCTVKFTSPAKRKAQDNSPLVIALQSSVELAGRLPVHVQSRCPSADDLA